MIRTYTLLKSLLGTCVSLLLLLAAASTVQAQPFAYITSTSNSVSVINTATNTVIASVPVGGSPIGVAVNPGGSRAYIANDGSNTVSVINTLNNTVIATIPVGTNPRGIALSADGTRVYTANQTSATVSVIDTATNMVIASPAAGATPYAIAINPAGTRLYVGSAGASGIVSVINTATNAVVATVPAPNGVRNLVVNPAGTFVYVTSFPNDNVSAIDTATNMVVATVVVGDQPIGVAVNPAGTRAYVANSNSASVSVIDTAINTVVATVPVGNGPTGISVDPTGTRVYTANASSDNVSVIDTATNMVVATVPVGNLPQAIGKFIGGPSSIAPGAPTGVTAVAGDGTATVNYSPPAFDGGSMIFNYTATSTPGGITANTTGGPIIVTGLTNGIPYTFTVTATNSSGTGPPSAPSNSVTPLAALVACQFTAMLGAWNVAGNWANCSGGDGVPAGTPGPSNRAEVSGGRTAVLPSGAFTVGDLYLGASTLQGAGPGATTLNVVAAGGIAWGSGSYTFQDITAVFTSTNTIPAANGPMTINNAVLRLATTATAMSADTINIVGAGARIENNGVFHPSTSLTMSSGGVFQNEAAGIFYPLAPITLNGTFTNAGVFFAVTGAPVTMSNAAAFSQAGSGSLAGDGSIVATGQTLTVASGYIEGFLTFTLGTLNNTGAIVSPGSLGIGTITVNGNMTVGATAAFDFDIDSLASFDRVNITGTINFLGGDLNVFYGAYTPVLGDTFNAINHSGFTGSPTNTTHGPPNDVFTNLLPMAVQFEIGPLSGSTATVTNTNDAGPGSLRDAILGLNTCDISGGDILFSIGTGAVTISPLTPLPPITCPMNLRGYSQAGSSANTSSTDWNATLNLTLNGSMCSTCNGITINAANVAIEGINFTNWNVGVRVNTGGDDATIFGNYFFQSGIGVLHNGGENLNIGSIADPADRNVFVHSTIDGIRSEMFSGSFAPHIKNNLIGVGAGFTPGPNPTGIRIAASSGVTVAQNLIASNGKGVVVASGTGNAIVANSIYNNTIIGVDLGDDGPTANDTVDVDTGANGLVNFPVITSANLVGGNLVINFTLDTTLSTSFVVYACASSPVSAQNQCKKFLGSTSGSTGGTPGFSGSLTILAGTLSSLGVAFPADITLYTELASGPDIGASSEFSAKVTVTAGAPAVTVTGTTTFPATTVGTASAPQAITITNSGTATLTMSLITASNVNIFFDSTSGPAPNSAHWCGFGSVTGGAPSTGSPINIAPGNSCVINSVFMPNAVGGLSSSIIINSNAASSPTTITLTGSGVAAATPSMTVAFAPTAVTPGANANMTLTLTNPNPSPAGIGSGSITIPAGLTATPPGTNTCGTFGSVSAGVYSFGMGSVPGSGSCTIVLTVQSPTPGMYTANIAPGALNAGGNNTNSSSATLTVSALLPPTISFAVVPTSITVGGTSVGTLTINNPNAVPQTANPVLFNYLPGLVNAPTPNASSTCVGANITATPGAGSYTQNTTFTLPASGSCTFSATITSNTAGTYSGNIAAGLIVTPAGSSNATPFNITVTPAPAPAVTLTPPSVNFGTRTVNTTSPPSTVTLGNSGSALLTIASITASGDFAFTTTCPLGPSTLAVGIGCPISITFTPLAATLRSGGIAIASNAPGSPHTITLSGTGSAAAVPGISFAPATLTFGAQTVNTTSATQNVVVTNTGFANLTLSSITVAAPFGRVPLGSVTPPDCGASVAPSSSCQIGVNFGPTAAGVQTGQISIIDNATGSPHSVPLTGTGAAIPVAVINATAAVAFGDQVINSPAVTRVITIDNTGTIPLTISAITLTGTNAANYTVTGQSGCVSIAPGASCTLTVSFTTTVTGARTAQVTLTSNAQNAASVNIPLTANGILAPRAVVSLSATAVGYGNVIFGGATPNQIITLTNGGAQAMTISSIVITGDFVQMNNCGTSLASLASCTISILFTPLGQGSRFGEFILTTSAASSPDRIQLSGTGCRWFSQAQSRFFLTSCG